MKLMPMMLVAIAVLLPTTISYADNSAPAKTTPAATAVVPKGAPDVTYPYTFTCSHCGIKMTVKSPAEWKMGCDACACGMKKSDCAPKKK